jgi:hypothetical protein
LPQGEQFSEISRLDPYFDSFQFFLRGDLFKIAVSPLYDRIGLKALDKMLTRTAMGGSEFVHFYPHHQPFGLLSISHGEKAHSVGHEYKYFIKLPLSWLAHHNKVTEVWVPPGRLLQRYGALWRCDPILLWEQILGVAGVSW